MRGPERCSGFSPVILTVIMVAITLVLAAVLYVMVVNYEEPEEKIYRCNECGWSGIKSEMTLLEDTNTDIDWTYDNDGDAGWTYDTDTVKLYLCPDCGAIILLETD